MTGINTSSETKERFKKKKMEHSAELKKSVNEDKFLNLLLDKFEEKKK